MAAGLGMQLEPHLAHQVATGWGEYPWRMARAGRRPFKRIKCRRERRRARLDPECPDEYGRYRDTEF